MGGKESVKLMICMWSCLAASDDEVCLSVPLSIYVQENNYYHVVKCKIIII